ncbi:MAG: chemotaxis protein CheW [Oscillospiraceae bacterium]
MKLQGVSAGKVKETNMTNELFAAQEEVDEQEIIAETSRKHLTFFSDNLQYAIDVENVNEIITNYAITYLPKVPSFIKGIMNLRGQVTPVVDIRLLMGRPEAEPTSETCVIILEVKGISIGILVDGVSRVIDLNDDQISPPPANINQELVCAIANVDGVINLLLDCDKLVDGR